VDIFDRAQEFDELFRQSALCEHLAKNKGLQPLVLGFCEDCGDKIPAARLKAYPQATRCIECQEKKERGHGSFGGQSG
jgi:DnaK suppressor protein